MANYNVTVSRTGGIKVEANSALEASKKVNAMNTEEIEKLVSFCDYEVTDVTEQPDPVFYYCLTRKNSKNKRFFRSDKEMTDTSDIIEYAVAANVILRSLKHLYRAELLDEEVYRDRIVSQLKVHFDNERSDFHNALKNLSVDDVISSADKIQFYDDIIHLLDDRSNDDDFNLKGVENLLDMEKPLDYLFEKNYVKIDFSSTNEQMIDILNSEG